jgi:uncharacterized damage-inducible protein DinB
VNDLLVELFRHNTWANVKMIEFCRDLPPEQRDSDTKIEGTYGAVRETLQHMIQSQEYYLNVYGRWSEPPRDFTTWDDLVDRARKSSQAYEQWTAETPAGQALEAVFGDNTWRTPTWIILTQMIDHCTEHRTHVGTVLAKMGVQSPPVDMWAYGTDAGPIDIRPKA